MLSDEANLKFQINSEQNIAMMNFSFESLDKEYKGSFLILGIVWVTSLTAIPT